MQGVAPRKNIDVMKAAISEAGNGVAADDAKPEKKKKKKKEDDENSEKVRLTRYPTAAGLTN